jgi:hypothetical protein
MAKRRTESTSGGGLAEMSVAELQAEIARREKGLTKLRRKRERLLKNLAEVESALAQAGAALGGGRRGPRMRNDSSLLDALIKVLTGKTMSVTEAAEAVQNAGYKTSSPNFRTIVNQCFISNKKKFKRVSRGNYTAA